MKLHGCLPSSPSEALADGRFSGATATRHNRPSGSGWLLDLVAAPGRVRTLQLMSSTTRRTVIAQLRKTGRERQEAVRLEGAAEVEWREALLAGLPDDEDGLAWFAAAHGLNDDDVEAIRRWSK